MYSFLRAILSFVFIRMGLATMSYCVNCSSPNIIGFAWRKHDRKCIVMGGSHDSLKVITVHSVN